MVLCENYNCLYHSYRKQQKMGPAQCTLPVNYVDHSGMCTQVENRPDSQYQTTILKQLPKGEAFLPGVEESLEQIIQDTIKAVGGTGLLKVVSYPSRRSPYLGLLVAFGYDKKDVVVVEYKPKV